MMDASLIIGLNGTFSFIQERTYRKIQQKSGVYKNIKTGIYKIRWAGTVYTAQCVVIQWRGSGGLLARRMNDEREKKTTLFLLYIFFLAGGCLPPTNLPNPREEEKKAGAGLLLNLPAISTDGTGMGGYKSCMTFPV